MTGVVISILGLIVALVAAVPGIPLIVRWSRTRMLPRAKFVSPSLSTTSRSYDVLIKFSNYKDSDETIWLVVKSPGTKVWYVLKDLPQGNPSPYKFQILIGSEVDAGEFRLRLIAVGDQGDAELRAFQAAHPEVDWGMQVLPEDARILDNAVVRRG